MYFSHIVLSSSHRAYDRSSCLNNFLIFRLWAPMSVILPSFMSTRRNQRAGTLSLSALLLVNLGTATINPHILLSASLRCTPHFTGRTSSMLGMHSVLSVLPSTWDCVPKPRYLPKPASCCARISLSRASRRRFVFNSY